MSTPFKNSGGITPKDGELLIESINETNPKVYIEIGTGSTFSASKVFDYLVKNSIDCKFYTIDVNSKIIDGINETYGSYSNFKALQGLSVTKNELTSRAKQLSRGYEGEDDVLRKLLKQLNQKVDICFIDSIKGSSLAEFKIIVEHLQDNGVIFCHDILNNGKGVEVKEYLDLYPDKFIYEVIDTGTVKTNGEDVKPGMLRIKLKNNE